MKKTQTNEGPSNFEDAFVKLGFDDPEQNAGATNLDNDIFDKEDVVDLNDTEDPAKPEDHKIDDTNNGTDDKSHDDDSEIPDEVLNQNKSQKDIKDVNEEDTTQEDTIDDDLNKPEDNTDEIDPEESTQVGAFFDAFADSLGWDVDDENKPDSIEGLIDYIKDLVDENSKPDYANDQIKQLDEYVKNGGNFTDFYNNMSQTISYDDMNIDDESNQRTAIRDYLKTSGYTDAQISKKLERYEEADMLHEEAEDAIERLKDIKKGQLEQQQAYQEQKRLEMEEQNRKVYTDITNNVQSLNEIYGIKVPQQDRKALLDYILKTDAEGHTQYEKDYQKNFTKNLIESAYFTMKGDTLVKEAKRTGESSATTKLRNILKHQSKNHSTFNANEEKQTQAWDLASKYL